MVSPTSFVPARRASGLVSERLDGEALIYVESSHRAFCLNPAAARVWEAIDGARDVALIARSASVEPDHVLRTLREMSEAGLLAQPAPEVPVSAERLSRRRMIRAGLVAIPLIVAITVPRAAEAASACTVGLPGGPACGPPPAGPACCSGICNESLGSCG